MLIKVGLGYSGSVRAEIKTEDHSAFEGFSRGVEAYVREKDHGFVVELFPSTEGKGCKFHSYPDGFCRVNISGDHVTLDLQSFPSDFAFRSQWMDFHRVNELENNSYYLRSQFITKWQPPINRRGSKRDPDQSRSRHPSVPADHSDAPLFMDSVSIGVLRRQMKQVSEAARILEVELYLENGELHARI